MNNILAFYVPQNTYFHKIKIILAVHLVHACNPSYSGGRDQEDFGSKPGWANNS
jgi:hypothetical protein